MGGGEGKGVKGGDVGSEGERWEVGGVNQMKMMMW